MYKAVAREVGVHAIKPAISRLNDDHARTRRVVSTQKESCSQGRHTRMLPQDRRSRRRVWQLQHARKTTNAHQLAAVAVQPKSNEEAVAYKIVGVVVQHSSPIIRCDVVGVVDVKHSASIHAQPR